MSAKTSSLYDTVTALAAAIEAYRLCGNRVASGKNSIMVESYLRDPTTQSGLQITDDSLAAANAIRSYLPKKLVFLALTGHQKSNFHFVNEMVEHVQHDQIARSKLGLIVWAPKIYEDFIEDDKYREELALCSNSRFVGELGKKLSTKITVIKKRLVKNFGSWLVTGYDENRNLIEFWHRTADFPDVITVSGRVRKQLNSSFNNGLRITTINYVKILELISSDAKGSVK